MPKPTRRTVLKTTLQATADASLFGAAPAISATMPVRGGGPEVYTKLGVEPFINCTSTYTINGGSRQLPQVIRAVEQGPDGALWLLEDGRRGGRGMLLRIARPGASAAGG